MAILVADVDVYLTNEPLATKAPLAFSNTVPEPDKITALLLKLTLDEALSVRTFDIVVVEVQPLVEKQVELPFLISNT